VRQVVVKEDQLLLLVVMVDQADQVVVEQDHLHLEVQVILLQSQVLMEDHKETMVVIIQAHYPVYKWVVAEVVELVVVEVMVMVVMVVVVVPDNNFLQVF
tara:strand:+ start:172 stop:471 length:300 start_codon:yes stop_codon:yes gene_type:complete